MRNLDSATLEVTFPGERHALRPLKEALDELAATTEEALKSPGERMMEERPKELKKQFPHLKLGGE